MKQNPYGEQKERFLDSDSFYYSPYYSNKYNNDIEVLNVKELVNIIIYTGLKEELTRSKGSAIKLLTAPIDPEVGIIESEGRSAKILPQNSFSIASLTPESGFGGLKIGCSGVNIVSKSSRTSQKIFSNLYMD